jgi:hypothetical protein
VWVVRRSEDFVKCLRSRAEFRRIGLANRDCARAPDSFDNNIVFGGDVVFIEQRSKCRANASGLHQILVRDRQTMERPQRLFARLHLIGLHGGVGGHFRHQGYNGIDFRVHALDLLQVRGQGFAGGQLLHPDQPRHLDRAHKINGGSGGLSIEKRRGSHSQKDFAAG